MNDECYSCEQEMPKHECPKSKRECGHHCNHSWEQDECCWCGERFGEETDYYRDGNIVGP